MGSERICLTGQLNNVYMLINYMVMLQKKEVNTTYTCLCDILSYQSSIFQGDSVKRKRKSLFLIRSSFILKSKSQVRRNLQRKIYQIVAGNYKSYSSGVRNIIVIC